MRTDYSYSRVLHVDLETGRSRVLRFGSRAEHLGGSGLAAALYATYGLPEAPALDPRQPLIFAVGPLTGFFPLMSKVVCGFRSPYTGEWAESHAGGRLALSLRFAGYDALMVTGAARGLSALVVGARTVDVHDVSYLRGADVFSAGKYLRRFGKSSSGHRSCIRIGPSGERGVHYACINVDSFRHFGRLGAGAVMGAKNLKGIVVQGDGSFVLPEGNAYAKLMREVYKDITATDKMRKYHDLGTPANLLALNELKALPWNNLQKTSDERIDGVSGETFADKFLLRQTACAGCPVGCIHIGLLRQQFAKDHEFLYKQVSYDYESIFAQGTMLGLTDASDVLALLDETEKLGLDCMSSGVALAWVAEASEKGVLSEKETIVPIRFGEVQGFLEALRHLGMASNEFYRVLGTGTLKAADIYGGADYACVLGQEMAGYATGEVFFVAQAYGFRHSHLDSGGYSWDQSAKDKDAGKAVDFLVDDEYKRILINSMVSCMFARASYGPDRIGECLESVGLADVAANLGTAGKAMQALRWNLKCRTGFDVHAVRIPKRYSEVVTWKGGIDEAYMNDVRRRYEQAILDMAAKAPAISGGEEG
ncbi:aldehyde ferredoxin oxidoreductase [Desulfovibrio subterraneus]|uniref:Aldehyde ferredoxin oxidoreductase n=1 Tax=Desulfovibrio subterraneus TaxID=2718620 RepID=A0A7J0BG44_9BACT|nr:aldehyde ferredoxin oxidoreductase N-terminal domain-containing protein [Desulfovibrio subterraneus]WBF66943.1 aldehyde ferredoxin oxidoreductase [Desulfovibrio subterraneus]GFM32670.1 aldehyde ferredoxin oxidoreductase [Desulfovibrio subterraneus]